MEEKQLKALKLEQDRVHSIIEEIDRKAAKWKASSSDVGSDALQIRKTFWEDVTVNFDEADDVAETFTSIKQQAALLSERERTQTQMVKQLKTLSQLRFSPYFGRVDFKEEGENEAEEIYLGIASLMDEQEENFLIYDWRAPISGLYYDYSPGPAQYETETETIQGDMELKRQFVIKSGKIKAMFETGVTIGDEMLQEVLGNNADTQMKTIVATIQKEQNQIIRNGSSSLVVVQGVAGSGKTSAAMQRVAYLLYRYRNIISSENIMLFSPNPLFNSYVATVLPELGEENMQQATFQEYLLSRFGAEYELEDPFEQMEYLLAAKRDESHRERVEGIRFKASLEFKELLDQYAEKLSMETLVFKSLRLKKTTIISRQEISQFYDSLDKAISIPNRIQLVKEWLIKELKKKARTEKSQEWVEKEIQFLEKEDYLEAFKQSQKKQGEAEDTFHDYDREEKWLSELVVKRRFKPLFNAVKKLKFINNRVIFLNFFKDESLQSEATPANWSSICDQTIQSLERKAIRYEDATPLLYLQDLIEGRKSNTSIRHVFIDEAQDYTPFQFAYIKNLFPYSKMTLLGDINQAIYSGPTGAPTIFAEATLDFGQKETYKLSKTYRSTKQIVEFTRQLIEGGNLIEPFNRIGPKPVIVNHRDHADHIGRTNELISDLENKGHKNIAIICKTAAESKEAFESIKKAHDARLIEKGTLTFENGVNVVPTYLAKGIEFDAVIIFDSSSYTRDEERKLLYTACTRAMHELYILSRSELSPLLENVDEKLYQVI
ncbi:UvrD-helicase domain-containing protein [Bacillus sp. ISL-35]|uniref:RNA polymerase recycling motor HelD n=1 Tax=Bacillus sp. ISL-35 TaxID=2819122 RepID=UPI001BE84971|nr:RNA polymerase recycling motor HelD [Bacillus sp. ISL-35]MBT2680841.1 UvrD-helicase domain-containing protein [Bacillus sp. ISL-35]MBT2705157.1 UvrD-helicase domain-containing protein [Chryseobacterium sp. ISL-80]